MAINELIASGGTPITPDNPIRNALAISQLRGEDIRSGEAERLIRNRTMLNALAKKHTDASGKTDLDAVRTELATGGNWDMSTAVADKQKQQFADDLEQAKARQAARNQYLAQATTPEQIMEWHKANHSDPFTGRILADAGITTDKSVATIASLKTPEQIEDFKARALLGSKEMFDRLHQQGQLKIQQGNLAVNQGQLAETTRHNMAMEGKESGKSGGVQLTEQDDQLLGKALNEGRLNPEDVSNPTRMKAALTALRENPKADIVKNRIQSEVDKKAQVLSATDQAKRDAAYPKATQKYQAVVDELGNTLKDIEALKTHTGLSGMTGLVYGNTPNVKGPTREAQTIADRLVSDSAINKIADMRANSPTGAALGNTSDADMKLIKAAASRLKQNLDTADYQEALDDYKATVEQVLERNKAAYEDTYSYKANTTPSKPAAGGWGKATVEGE